jgi:3-ketosteroid 9alpha-monooxygenase subunit B
MFHSLCVAAVVEETPDARSIVFDVPPALRGEFAYLAGQFLTVRVDCDGELLQRCYSLSSAPGCDEDPRVTVKRVKGGRVSNWLLARLRAGDRVDVMGPQGRFVLDQTDAPLLFFAAGSGVTPILSLLKTALTTTSRSATLLYANRSADSVIFRDELASLQRASSQRLRVVHRFDGEHGPLDERSVRALGAEHRSASCYVCGPGPFMGLVERALVESGVETERIRTERFALGATASPASPSQVNGAAPEYVDVELRGSRHRVAYRSGQTLLQAARDAGLDAPYSCEEGFCGCCAADLLEGKVSMAADDALSEAEKRRGMILPCQSRPVTARCTFRFVDS